MRDYIALIPAYEPSEVLVELVCRLHAAGMKIVVVDDGSGEDYRWIFDRVSRFAQVISYPVNQGKGNALKTGLTQIQKIADENSVVVTVDADGQHRAEDAVRLCEEAERQHGTLFLGSRGLKEAVPLRSRLGNTITRLVYYLAAGVKIHDTQTGLRACSASLIPALLQIPGGRYEYEMNVLLEFARRRIPIAEMEIETIYINHNEGSHFQTLRDSCRVYKEILKFSTSSFVGFLTDYALYSLLLFLAADIRIANVGARVVSAGVNYTLNRKFVFQSRKGVMASVLQYVLLAAVILAGNTIVLEQLVNGFGVNRFAAKLLTEILFFFVSWSVQHCIIFKKGINQ